MIAILAGVYFVAGKLGLALAFVHPSATAFWSPTGITLAAFLLLGYRVWPGVFLGAFLVNTTTAGSVATSLGIAMGNTLEGLAGAYLVNRFANGRNAFDRPQDIVKFIVLAAMVSTAVSATVGVTSLSLGGSANWADYGSIWLTWWLGDAGGDLIVAPLLVLWSGAPRVKWHRAQVLEVILLLLLIVLVGQAVFAGLFHSESKTYPLGFLYPPFLVWIAFRLGQRETATTTFVFSCIAIWGTLRGFGPFARETQNESLLLLQAFLGVNAMIAMTLAAAVLQRRGAVETLRRAHEELEVQVEERTSELRKANTLLTGEITERTRVEEKLRANEERFRAVAETAADAIVSADKHGHITYFNPAAERIFGYAARDVIGRPLTLLMPQRFQDAHRQGLARFLKTGESRLVGSTVQMMGRRREGTEFHLDLSLSCWKAGGDTFFTAIIRDITARKQMEEALHRDHQALEVLTAEVSAGRERLEVLAQRLMEAQEDERRAIAHDLHEEIGQSLTAIKLNVQSAQRAHPNHLASALDPSVKIIDHLIQQVRTLSLSLRPSLLDDLGLVATLRWWVELQGPQVGLNLELTAERIQPRLPLELATVCFRIVQEAVNNAVKHACAQGVSITLRKHDDRLDLTIRDDGVGFDVPAALADAAQGETMGLVGMEERVRALGGWLTIQSEAHRGTEIHASFPLSESAELHDPDSRPAHGRPRSAD
jgi:PAS domain S-box-containing protein